MNIIHLNAASALVKSLGLLDVKKSIHTAKKNNKNNVLACQKGAKKQHSLTLQHDGNVCEAVLERLADGRQWFQAVNFRQLPALVHQVDKR